MPEQKVALEGKLWPAVPAFHGSYSHFHQGHEWQHGGCQGGWYADPGDFPWHSEIMWATLTQCDSTDSSQRSLAASGGGMGKGRHVNVDQTETLHIRESDDKINAKTHLLPVWINIKRTTVPWPLLQNDSKRITVPDIFAILMRCSVTVKKTQLFCLLVGQTASLTSDLCCDPAQWWRAIPEGCTTEQLWCSYFVRSSFYNGCKRTALDKTRLA